MRVLCFVVALLGLAACSNGISAGHGGGHVVAIDLHDTRQSVAFGTDIKLTLSRVAAGDPDRVLDQFQALGFDMVRLPFYPIRTLDPYDPFYDVVWDISDKVEDRGFLVFGSVANGDGDQRNWLHRGEKFGDFLKCNCPGSLYRLDMEAYAAYVDQYVALMRDHDAALDVLGPFNEDRASAGDYRRLLGHMDETDFVMVGNEGWHLLNATDHAPEVNAFMDVVGAHFYDDKDIPDRLEEKAWADMVQAADGKPVWFTESTRFIDGSGKRHLDLVYGLNHIIPALRGGVERVVIYQGAPRLVTFTGDPVPYRYSGTKQFIAGTPGVLVGSRTSAPGRLRTVSFVDEGTLHTHVTNAQDVGQILTVSLDGGTFADEAMEVVVWSSNQEGERVSVLPDDQQQFQLHLPAQSYVYIHSYVNISSTGE